MMCATRLLLVLLLICTSRGLEAAGTDYELAVKLENVRSAGPATLRLNVRADDIIQVLVTPDGAGLTTASLMLADNNLLPPRCRVRKNRRELRITTRKLEVIVNRENGAMTFRDLNSGVLLRAGEPRISAGKVRDENLYQIRQEFTWADGEALFGLGQHQEGIYNWRGDYAELFQLNKRAVVPFLLSSNGYGILWDNYSYTRFNDAGGDSYIWSEVGDAINYYFIYGPRPDAVIANYRRLTGQAPLLPKWAYGYIQSKERYKSQEELLEVVQEHRERGIPLDVIVLDWKYWDDGHWGQKSFNAERFPDPQAMIEELHDRYHARLMISVWPKMSFRCADYAEMKAHEGFLYPEGRSPFYDAFNPEARALFWKQANAGLFSKGIDAWWCDATEPELDDWDFNRDAYIDKMKPAIGSGARYMNAYSLMHSKGIYEHQRQTTSAKRVVNLTRSAYAGQQRYATITWSGDVEAKWEVFAAQIPAGLNFCMSGLPYWTTDIGGFFVQSAAVGELGRGEWFRNGDFDGGVADDDYKDLYVRWFQYGAFCPIFRSHGTDISREVWRFGESGDWAFDALLKFDQLRYRLLPYIYSIAWQVTSAGDTLMRGLAMDFQHDPHVFEISDQYMFGPAILVNPVTSPKSPFRNVYLPEGCAWYNFWTGKKYSGSQTLPVPTPIGEIPLFVRAGSIVPLGPFIQYATESADPLEIRIYPGADAHFTLYEDEGDSYNYEQGAYSIIEFDWDDQSEVLTIGKRRGAFHGMPNHRELQLVRVKRDHGTGVESTPQPDHVVEYSGDECAVSYAKD